jgi:hypothetical protein
MLKRDFARHIDRWIAVFAAHEADSPQGIAAVHEMITVGRAACLFPDDVVELAACIGKAVRRMRETEMRALATGVGVQ